jgi:hypothetical protein
MFIYIILTKACKILHNKCIIMLNCFMAACFKEILVSFPWRWRDNGFETCRSYANCFNHKLQISAFVVVTWFIYCIIMHRISNAKFIRIRFPFLILGLTTKAYTFFVRCILTRKEKIASSNIFVDLNFVPCK